jgi:phosphohistidine phosphatase SixA
MVLATGSQTAVADEAALWQALRSPGHIAVMRHALAPGGGDPDAFQLRDCTTQRNLSDGGRAQAKRIGARLRANGVAAAQVYSSQWCRCLETARLLGSGAITELPALNSFFQSMDRREDQTIALKEWIKEQPLTIPTILVTHQVNITALTGIFPASGEIVVLRRAKDGTLAVVSTAKTD